MFIPLHDRNPLKNITRPYATWGLIAVNVAVFLWGLTQGDMVYESWIAGGLIPLVLFGGEGPIGFELLPGPVTLITYQFLHGGWMHLIGNMVFLYIFGDNVEDATGHWRFIAFYLLCGVAAGLAHSMTGPDSQIPLIGASGATSGLVGAYLVLHPRVRFWVLALGRIPLRLRAYWVIGAWIAWQILFLVSGADDEVAWTAHLGGFVAGAALIVLMRQKNVMLWDQDLMLDPPKPDGPPTSTPS